MPDDVLAFARAVLARTSAAHEAPTCPACGTAPQTTRDGMCAGCTTERRRWRRPDSAESPLRTPARVAA